MAGSGSTVTLALECPVSITLDADGNLFIVNNLKHRVVRVAGGVGDCIVGCSSMGAAANQLQFPWAIAFDNQGNLFVSDRQNHRIQKFQIAINQCGE